MMTRSINLGSLKSLWETVCLWNEKRQFKRKHQLAFLSNMALLTKSGMRVDIALKSLSQLGAARAVEKKVAKDLAAAVTKGDPLHYAMEKWFDADIAAAFSASTHHSGAAENITESLIERGNWLKSKIDDTIRSNAYLFIAAGAGIVALLFVGLNILPRMSANFESGDIPVAAALVMQVADFLSNYGLFLIVTGGAATYWLIKALKNVTSAFRLETLDNVFPFSLYKQITTFNNLSQLIKLIEWGDTPLQAAQKIKAYTTPYMAHFMSRISTKASGGEQDIHSLLDVGVLSPAGSMQTQLAAKAETAAVTNEIINSVPVVLQVETQSMLKKLKHVLNASLTALIVAILLALFFSMLSIYSQLIATTTVGY